MRLIIFPGLPRPLRIAADLAIGGMMLAVLVSHASAAKTPTVAAAQVPIPLERPDRGAVTALIRAAEANGVPADLAVAIAFTESRFDCRATSKAGARGIAQVMPKTARGMGFDPHLLHSCTTGADAGMKYLRKMLDACNGNPLCAARKFNAGPNRKGWPDETRGYVAKIAELIG